MKIFKTIIIIVFIAIGSNVYSQDTLYIHKKIGGIEAIPVNNIDSIIFYDSKTVTDADGNVYTTVTIGTQVWMAQNLKTTKYNDGTAIPLVTDGTAWANLSTPGYCWYKNDEQTYKNPYGALYNWYAVNTTKLCPSGWHVPSNTEWDALFNYLGGTSVAGGKMKTTGTLVWTSPNTGATNSSGFNGWPNGIRGYNGTFASFGNYGNWWYSTEGNATHAWRVYLPYNQASVGWGPYNKKEGYSVRCIKD